MKRFTKNDSGFICQNCGFEVEPLSYTSRNHCPKCLCSLHVDILPGDRACECRGILQPIFAEPAAEGFVITHKCQKCGAISKNKSAVKKKGTALPDEQFDDTDLLIKLTAKSAEF